jgi:micrococcal nuclease
LEGGQRVRYIGIDTPETVDPRRPVGCFGKEASTKNKELVEGKRVRLEKDVSETDSNGRLLRYIYITVGGQEIMVNDYLVREGYAHSSAYPPDIKYQNQFDQAEQEARENKRGLWGACPTD